MAAMISPYCTARRALALAFREQYRRERDDFFDQVEAAELLFAGVDCGDDEYEDDLPPYVGDIEM